MKPFKAHCVYAGNAEGYLEISFQESKDQVDDRPYINVQRDPEETDPKGWYIEACDPEGEWGYGHYAIKSAELTRTRFRIRWGAAPGEAAEVYFQVDENTFAQLVAVARLMFPAAR